MQLKRERIGFYKATKGKFTYKTMIKRMMLMGNFILSGIFMMALFFGK